MNQKSTQPGAAEGAGRHTPGPWSLAQTKPQGSHYVNVLAPNGGLLVSVSMESQFDMEWFDNARLIAAAPDFYSAYAIVAKRLGDVCAAGGTMQDFLNAGSLRELEAARSKAEGRTQP